MNRGLDFYFFPRRPSHPFCGNSLSFKSSIAYAVQHHLYCIVLYCIVLYCIVLYCIVLYCIVLYCIVLYCIVLYCIVLYCIVLYCIVLYCIVLYCIVLYCIVLYCIVLYCIVIVNRGLDFYFFPRRPSHPFCGNSLSFKSSLVHHLPVVH